MLVAVYFNILAEIPSGPLALDTSKDAKRSNTSSSVQRCSAEGAKCKSFKDDIGACDLLKHEWKNELRRSAFSHSAVAVASLRLSVGTDLDFLLRNFTAFQNFFGSLGLSLQK